MPPRSRACMPAMVVPPGLATESRRAAGCCQRWRSGGGKGRGCSFDKADDFLPPGPTQHEACGPPLPFCCPPGLTRELPPPRPSLPLPLPTWPDSSMRPAAPRTVLAARASATSRGRPAATPPSASASMNMSTKAGPEPERPVTAGQWERREGTGQLMPSSVLSHPSSSHGGRTVHLALADDRDCPDSAEEGGNVCPGGI